MGEGDEGASLEVDLASDDAAPDVDNVDGAAPDDDAAPDMDDATPDVDDAAPDVDDAAPDVDDAAPDADNAAPDDDVAPDDDDVAGVAVIRDLRSVFSLFASPRRFSRASMCILYSRFMDVRLVIFCSNHHNNHSNNYNKRRLHNNHQNYHRIISPRQPPQPPRLSPQRPPSTHQ